MMTNFLDAACGWCKYRTSSKYLSYITIGLAIVLIIFMLHRNQSIYTFSAPPCPGVLGRMTQGKWIDRSYSGEEVTKLNEFLQEFRTGSKNMPAGLQRKDKLCGNVTFVEDNRYRALCDAEGDTPCCYNNRCLSKTVDQCKCKDCYDLRQQKNVELSDWTPLDDSCKMQRYNSPDSVCRLLNNMTIYVIGDSFMRQFYISLMFLLRKSEISGPLKRSTLPDIISKCLANKQFLYPAWNYPSWCDAYIDRDSWECQGKVQVKFLEYNRIQLCKDAVDAINKIKGKNNSFVFFGIGMWEDFNSARIIDGYLRPIYRTLSSSRWPIALWSSMHAPGLLKNPRLSNQTREALVRYNNDISRELEQFTNIPVFNAWNVADGTTSYDGAHYGKGVNDAKVQIFLNYILELKIRKELQ